MTEEFGQSAPPNNDFHMITKNLFRNISFNLKLKSNFDTVVRKTSLRYFKSTLSDNPLSKIVQMLDKHTDYVKFAGRSYHWNALLGTKTTFTQNDVDKFPSLEQIANRVEATDDDKIYKLAIVVRRMTYTAESEKILWLNSSNLTSNKHSDVIQKYSNYINICFPEIVDGHYSELVDENETYQFTCVTPDGYNEYVYLLRRLDDRMLPTVFCIVANRIAYHFYDSVLREVAVKFQTDKQNAYNFLQTLQHKYIPSEGSLITFPVSNSKLFLYCWPKYEDRWIENTGFLCYHSSVKVLINLINAVLCSYSIICFSHNMSKLSRCVHAISMLMYPFIWPYQLVTLMPTLWALDFLEVPSPFIYGCLSSLTSVIKSKCLRNILLVDLDSDNLNFYDQYGHMHSGNVINLNKDITEVLKTEDIPCMPSILIEHLSSRLSYLKRFRLTLYEDCVTSIIASEAFLEFFVSLLEQLPSILDEIAASLDSKGEDSINLKSEDVRSRLLSRSIQNKECWLFLNHFTSTMMFTSFIETGRWRDEKSGKFFRRVKEIQEYRGNKSSSLDTAGMKDVLFENFKELCDNLDAHTKSMN